MRGGIENMILMPSNSRNWIVNSWNIPGFKTTSGISRSLMQTSRWWIDSVSSEDNHSKWQSKSDGPILPGVDSGDKGQKTNRNQGRRFVEPNMDQQWARHGSTMYLNKNSSTLWYTWGWCKWKGMQISVSMILNGSMFQLVKTFWNRCHQTWFVRCYCQVPTRW